MLLIVNLGAPFLIRAGTDIETAGEASGLVAVEIELDGTPETHELYLYLEGDGFLVSDLDVL